MADNTINVRIKDRSDTEANWTSKNPVLLKGERAITDGTGKYKIGDGKNTWSALPYYEAMTSADRTKLNGIASGANKTTVDSSLNSSSTNPVQNKVVNSALAGKSNTNHTHDLSTMINTLSTGSATPTDEDYFVSQYVGGGTTTTTYHRRPVKALLEYIRGKFAKVATSGSYDDLSNKPTIGNGTVTITQGGTSKGTFTLNQTGNTTIALTDNNSWRGVQNNLTSTSTTDSLSAAQGKVLNDKFASYVPTSRTVNGKALSANISLNASDVGASASGHTHTAINNGITICGRTQNSGDDEGLVINKCGNNYAGLILGSPNGVRSVFYLTSDNSALWRYNNGSSSFDINHPKKAGTVALTSDIPSKLPASDVYAWAKASTKPSYSWSEISGKPSTYTPSSHTHDDRYYTESEMNSKLNGKANSNHTHSQYYDSGISRTANMVLAAPDGSNGGATFRKLVSADLPGNYAGSSSAGGAANSAVKLAAARTVSNTEDFVMSFSYDGSANSNASLRYYNSCISVGNTNNYPYHRFAKIDTQTSSYVDKTSTFLITQDYNGGGWGIVRISLRTNNSSSVSTVEAKWLARCDLKVDCVQIGLYNVFGKTYADAFFKTSGTYTGTVIRNLASGARGNISRTWTLIDSEEANSTTTSDKKASTESYVSTSAAATTLHSQAYTSVVVASDGGTVSYANSAGNASKVNNYTVNSNVPSGAKFTDTVYSHPTTSGNKHIPSGGSSGQILRWSSDGTAVWGNDNNTTYSEFVKSGSGAKAGLVPAPSTTAGTTKYLREDGTWTVPPDNNTTYSNMTAATASAAGKAGLVPAPAAGKQASFLRGDGTWVVPTNTTYSTGTTSTAGLTKLYTGAGTATDGTMTQSAIKTALDGKAASSHTHDDRYYTETEINNKLGDLSSLSSYGSDVTSILKAIIAKLPKTYSGSYSVTPSATNQSLSTSGKVMKDNVSVSAIPYKEESNSSGTTVTIG